MNISKYLSVGLIALMGAAFTACDGKDEPDYQNPSKPAETQRVYFAESKKSFIVGENESSVSMSIFRPETDTEELTVQLLPSETNDIFKLPAEVTFDKDSQVATFNITFDPAQLTANTPYTFNIAVDEANANAYGIASCAITVTREQWSEWTQWGKEEGTAKTGIGVYNFAAAFSGSWVCRVMTRYNPLDPKSIQYRVEFAEDEENPETTEWFTYFEMSSADGGKHITVPGQVCVIDNYNGEPIYIYDYSSLSSSATNKSYVDEVAGRFVLNLYYYVPSAGGGWGPADEIIQFPGFADTHEYYVAIDNASSVEIDGENVQVISFDIDPELDGILYTVVAGAIEDEAEIKTIADAIVAGDETAFQIESLSASKNVPFTFDASGDYTIVAVGLKGEGEDAVKVTSTLTFTYTSSDPLAGWTKIGAAALSDNAVAYLYNEPSLAYSNTIDVYESDANAGVVRAVNPYAGFPEAEACGLTIAKYGAYEIDLRNAEAGMVYMVPSLIGLSDADGDWEVLSFAYYMLATGAAPADVPAANWGTFADGKISFAATGVEKAPSCVVFIGEGAYYLDADITIDLNGGAAQAAPAIRKAIASGKMRPAKNLKRPAKRALFATKALPSLGKTHRIRR